MVVKNTLESNLNSYSPREGNPVAFKTKILKFIQQYRKFVR